VSLLFCTFIGFLQFRHRTRFRDSFCLASVFKCLFTYLLTYLLKLWKLWIWINKPLSVFHHYEDALHVCSGINHYGNSHDTEHTLCLGKATLRNPSVG